MFKLDALPAVTHRPKKRLGRGEGSGKGSHMVGRGGKGQTSRVGKPIPLWFEGGQLPMVKRLPFQRGKLRFKTLNKAFQLVTLAMLAKLSVKDATPATLKAAGLIHNAKLPVKLLGGGELKKAYSVSGGIKATQTAKAAIEKAGGSVSVETKESAKEAKAKA